MRPSVPALHISTWYDTAVTETTRLFNYLQGLGTPNQYLIIGAGQHCSMVIDEMISDMTGPELLSFLVGAGISDSKGISGIDLSDLDIGDTKLGDARYGGVDHGYAKLFFDWFEHWVNGQPNDVTTMPKVQLHVMGKGWVSGDRWPLERTRFTKYYLESGPASPSRPGTGVLSSSAPKRDANDRYIYDPGSPTPSLGGILDQLAPARDQRPIEARKDVLVYDTPPLESPVTIAGPVEVVLYVSSSAKDTDFMVKLVDVYPDGKAINLADDAFRVRYRGGFEKKVLMEPGKVYKITLPNMMTAIRFPKGHRIRLDIASSNFPLYERNLNTGGNNYDETAWVIAQNSIHHGKQYPSYVSLPVIPE